MTQISRLALACCAALLAAVSPAAGAVGPNYRQPYISLTPTYLSGPMTGVAGAPSGAWWDSFNDPVLTWVVAQALAENLDIRRAQARLLQARAQAGGAGAALLPLGEATGGVSDTSQSLVSPIGALLHHLPGFERQFDQYQLGTQASWDIDLFGGLSRERQSAVAQANASAADLAAVRVNIAADSADAYLQIRAFQARIAVTQRQEGIQQDLLALVRRRAAQGVASDRETHEAAAILEGVQAGLPPLNAGLQAQFNRLDVLMGAQPGASRARLSTPADIPSAPSVASAGGPAALLRRRPDVVAAEQRMIAANASVGAAIADYYPKISISGLLGVNSIYASQIFTGSALESQIGAGLRWRLFDFGRVDAEVAQARGRYAESLAAWRGAVLQGASEVETAFSDLAERQARAKVLVRQIDDLEAARRQAQQAYEAGVISLIEVRDADRELLIASDQLAQTRADADRAAVAAFRALGGGWIS